MSCSRLGLTLMLISPIMMKYTPSNITSSAGRQPPRLSVWLNMTSQAADGRGKGDQRLKKLYPEVGAIGQLVEQAHLEEDVQEPQIEHAVSSRPNGAIPPHANGPEEPVQPIGQAEPEALNE